MDEDKKYLPIEDEVNPDSFFDDEDVLDEEIEGDIEEPIPTYSDMQMASSRRMLDRQSGKGFGFGNSLREKTLEQEKKNKRSDEDDASRGLRRAGSSVKSSGSDGEGDSKEKNQPKGPGDTSDTTKATQNGSLFNRFRNAIKADKDPKLVIASNFKNFLMKLKANPGLLVIVGALGLIVLVVFFVVLFGTDLNNGRLVKGGKYYNSPCSSMTVYDSSSGANGTYDLEEYIAGVVQAEVGGFNDAVVYEVAAVAARTYALRNQVNCTITGNTTKQAFTPTTNQVIIDAVANTNGHVLMRNGELISTMYDALAIVGESGNDYIISQQNQRIPKAWIHSQLSDASIEYYSNHYHGQGMSQWGAYYLSTEKGYSSTDILTYYYGADVEFVSIFGGVGNIDNYLVATSSGLNNVITEPLRSILGKNGSSVGEFNEYVLNNILEAGPGTRAAVVAAAVSVVGGLWENYQIRLPYVLSGQHYGNLPALGSGVSVNKPGDSFYGIDPDWGTPIGNFMYYYNGSWAGPYTHYGPDCSGFVAWALHNGGFSQVMAGADTQGNFGPRYRLTSSFVGQPGDLLWKPGHITLIVGVDTEAGNYYIAHASSRTEGVKINTVSYKYGSSGYQVVDMTNFYSTRAVTNDAEVYRNLFLGGMLT